MEENLMPAYPGVAGATAWVGNNTSGLQLEKGDYQYLFGLLAATATQLPVNDTNVTPEAASAAASQASISVNLQAGSEAMDAPPMICVEVRYPSAPGAGEVIAIQEADTDADAFYITPAAAQYTINNGSLTSPFVARVDLFTTGGKFLRVLRTKGANAVACTVKVTRMV
jgi:hypothetical protein